jgi:hypothetical protein
MTPTLPARRLLLGSAAIAALGALALPSVAGAQQPLTPVWVTTTNTAADRLDGQAAAYEANGDLRRLGKAARLRERAAALRTPDDPAAFASLRRAAYIRYGLGHTRQAGYLMERAGDQAIARGDVYNAASAYIDAAYVAANLRDAERVRHFVNRGTLLMHSPLLTAPQRDHLAGRVAMGAARVGLDVASNP